MPFWPEYDGRFVGAVTSYLSGRSPLSDFLVDFAPGARLLRPFYDTSQSVFL